MTRPQDSERLYSRTSERVDEMTDEARVELARNLAGRGDTVPDAGLRPVVTTPYTTARQAAEEQEAAAAALRIAADLQRTERRLYQIERALSRGRSRYQMGEGGPPTGRYARLLRRASRLERQLRALR